MKRWKKNSVPLERIYGEKQAEMSGRRLIPAFACFAGGILASRFILFSFSLLLCLFIVISLLLLVFLISPDVIKTYTVCFVFLFSGMLLAACSKNDADLVGLASGKKVIIEGTVLSPPRMNDRIMRFELKTEKILLNDKILKTGLKVLVTIYNEAKIIPVGTRIRFPSHLKPFMNFKNPGAYDYESSMRLKKISCNASVSDGRYIVPMGKGNPGVLKEITEYIRKPVREFLKEKLTERDYALYRALLLGERQAISDELREPFNATGMGHILAVSGLHIGIIAWLSFYLLRRLLSLSEKLLIRYDVKKIAALLTCIPVIAYTGLSGFQVSGQRAMIMVLTYLFSIVLGKERDIWSTLLFSALVILAVDPMALESTSFQLTFLAVSGILWLAPCIHSIFPDASVLFNNNRILKNIYFYTTGIVSASLSAVIFLLPVTIYYFYRISSVSVFANLIIIPLLGFLILPAGMFSIMILPVSSSLAETVLNIGASGVHIMMRIIEYLAGLPWASFWMVTPDLYEIILFYCLLFCIINLKKWQWVKWGMTVAVLLAVTDISFWIYENNYNPNLRVTFIDVGQGNSALIQFPGKKRMLIDGGGFRAGTFDTGKNVIAPFLFRKKILHVDCIVLTHPHPDHLNGLRFIASEFDPGEFWYNGDLSESFEFKELMDIAASRNMLILTPVNLAGVKSISGVDIEALHPSGNINHYYRDMSDNRAVNNRSLVLKMSYKGKSILFPGDIEEDTENRLVKKYGKHLNSDVLLVPHHGSKYSSTLPFLEMTSPEVCITSSRQGNSFGFPNPETIRRIKSTGSGIFRIDRNGAVKVEISDSGFMVRYCLD